MKTVFEMHEPGKNAYMVDTYGIAEGEEIPAGLLRDELDLPDINEVEAVRHYTYLSTLNFGVDSGMYPLGSCTMKHNPKINERTASLPGFTSLHPMAGRECAQGTLEMIYELGNYLSGVTGMSRFSIAPAAGAHGELVAVMIIKKYFEEKGENRKVILIPDSAHGTNPASVAMCGFEVKSVPSTPEGDVDMDALKEVLDDNVAGMMLTSPNTLGLFDRNIHVIADLLHEKDALFYCDGANLNAVMGKARINDMGFDIMHINLHKTFSTPHGGGGPGAGPIGVVSKLEKYLPVPVVEKGEEGYFLNYDRPESIGRIHSFYGNVLVMIRAYTYIRMLGAAGLRKVSETAVLNANYLLAKLKDHFYLPVDRTCMHEFVISDKGMPNHVTTNDIGKRILDYGFHAPTVYFPLIIEGAMMIEPTETESLETLDTFVDTMLKIKEEAEKDSELVTGAPHNLAFKKVDAVTAARKPVLKWTKE